MTAAGRASARVEAGTGRYVYGVVPAEEARAELYEGIHGVGGGSVDLVAAGDVCAIASTVALEEFGEEAISDNLRDPGWLEQNVRAHERVLEAALARVPVVPFRFGTIYRGEDQLRDALGEAGWLREALERVRGKVELGVKAFLRAPTAAATTPERGAESGRQYLEEKQRARRAAEGREALRARLADESHARLAAAADEAVANPLQPPELSGHGGEMFLNGAYLVAVGGEEAFRAAFAELERTFGADGAAYELTGPWPPYNFVEDTA